jgi:hypothetical protein
MIIKKIQSILIPLATRFEYDANSIIIIGGTKKKKILDTLKIKYVYQINTISLFNYRYIQKNRIPSYSKQKTTIERMIMHSSINK